MRRTGGRARGDSRRYADAARASRLPGCVKADARASARRVGFSEASALDCLHLAPGRGFSSPEAAVHNHAGISDHGPRRRSNRYHPRLRGVQASQLPDEQEQAQQPRPDRRCASTAAGAASTPATGRPASAGALLWPVTANVQSSAATAARRAAAGGRVEAGRRPASPSARDVPGALDHASGDVDEFDAALVRGAGGVPAAPEAEPDTDADTRRRGSSCRPAHSTGGDAAGARWRRRGGRRGRWRCPRAALRRSRCAAATARRLPARQLGRAPARTVARPPPGLPGDRRRARASWRSPAPTSAWPTMSPRKSSNSSSEES